MTRGKTFLGLVTLFALFAPPARPEAPLLVVLAETGTEREGFPVYLVDPDGAAVAEVLSRGLSGRLLRLYRDAQTYLHERQGGPVEPAYLLLSNNEGGFPRFGFFLGEDDKRHAGYVDLHRRSRLAGSLGALDQLFPHELAHVLVQQMAGAPRESPSGRVHGIGVQTDRVTAFQEGFAEHFQVLAVDDPAAEPETRALAENQAERAWLERRLTGYRRELVARWSPATRHRLGFLLWYGRAEQAMRYFAVKSNAFARHVGLPETLPPCRTYQLENFLPGSAGAEPKSASAMVASEGVVAAFFHRWSTDARLQSSYREESFYAPFGRHRDGVDGLDNVYLKLFHVLFAQRPRDTVELVAAVRKEYPADELALDEVIHEVFLDQPWPPAPALWLLNPDFVVGTSLYDQFRAVPRPHRFDLNAASLAELMTVPGVDRALAEEVLAGGPYRRVAELERVSSMTPSLLERFSKMARASDERWTDATQVEEKTVSLLRKILASYLWRFLAAVFAAGLFGAFAYRAVSGAGWIRASIHATGAAFVGLTAVLLLVKTPGGSAALVVPVAVFGVPAAVMQLSRQRSWRQALRLLLAWCAASTPAAILSTPFF